MHLFTGFLQTLTDWLQLHPHLALFITFAVSLCESFAIVGSIVPGSITMTAVGVLAGSGIMRIDLTLLAAIFGAVAGDTASYALGYACSDRLTDFWPFRRYPDWLQKGKAYFSKHGKKSVLIGRFFGPLRSIIPVIAGMMHMNQWQFLLANIISAIGWALLYVMPGVLIGAYSHELSAESATKLFAMLLAILVVAWLTSLGIMKLIIRANIWLAHRLHIAWARLKNQSAYIWLFKLLTPKYEKNHYRTAMLPIMLCLSLLCTVLLFLTAHTIFISNINHAVYYFLQSIRTPLFDTLLITISFIFKPLSLYSMIVACGLYAIFCRDLRLFAYWISLTAMAIICSAFLLKFTLIMPSTPILLHTNLSPLCLTMNFCIATALFSFLIFYVNKKPHSFITYFIQSFLTIFLLLVGFSYLYLGDNWLSSVVTALFMGLTLSLGHWIFYRRIKHQYSNKSMLFIILSAILILSTGVSYIYYFQTTLQIHHPKSKYYALNDNAWWSQQTPLLPIYATSRTGHRTGLFNIQYAGSLDALKMALKNYGWKSQSNSLLNNLIQRAEGQGTAKQLPLITQLHLNKKPVLNMIYSVGSKHKLYVLRLWNSNYYLNETHQSIWVGSIITPSSPKKSVDDKNNAGLFGHILPALKHFKTHITFFSNESLSKTIKEDSHEVLMIKENELNESFDSSND